VHYAAITYVTPSGYPPPSERILWLAGLSFMEHFARLMQLPGFTARVTFGDRPIEQDDRKRLAEQLWREVQRRYVPVE
jgi:hypothetical protein